MQPPGIDKVEAVSEGATFEPFKHTTIADDEIRLLRFFTRDSGTDIHLDVVTFPRCESPPYVALSYTWLTPASSRGISDYAPPQSWDESRPTRTVSIGRNRHTCLIGANLWFFLQRLQHVLVKTYFWADALCIDQSDIAERNRQVGAMGDTYRDAFQVLVWLGASDESTALAFTPWDFIKHEQQVAPSQEAQMRVSLAFPNWQLAQDYPRFSAFCAVWSLGVRPYWSRAWITQEVLLAKSIVVYCGTYEMPWSRLTENVHRALEFIRPFRQFADPHRLCPAARFINAGVGQPGDGERGLLSLIFRAYDRSCADPRDRVFALLGLLHEIERAALGPGLPNYNISQRDLFSRIVRHIISWHGTQLASDIIFELLELLDVPSAIRPLLGRRLLARLGDQFGPRVHPELSPNRDGALAATDRLQGLQLHDFSDGSATMQTVWEILQDVFGLSRLEA